MDENTRHEVQHLAWRQQLANDELHFSKCFPSTNRATLLLLASVCGRGYTVYHGPFTFCPMFPRREVHSYGWLGCDARTAAASQRLASLIRKGWRLTACGLARLRVTSLRESSSRRGPATAMWQRCCAPIRSLHRRSEPVFPSRPTARCNYWSHFLDCSFVFPLNECIMCEGIQQI